MQLSIGRQSQRQVNGELNRLLNKHKIHLADGREVISYYNITNASGDMTLIGSGRFLVKSYVIDQIYK